MRLWMHRTTVHFVLAFPFSPPALAGVVIGFVKSRRYGGVAIESRVSGRIWRRPGTGNILVWRHARREVPGAFQRLGQARRVFSMYARSHYLCRLIKTLGRERKSSREIYRCYKRVTCAHTVYDLVNDRGIRGGNVTPVCARCRR